MSSSSEDDRPIRSSRSNGAKSADRIPKSLDKAMDKETLSNGTLETGISIRMGPVRDAMDVDRPVTNGVPSGKRKSRGSINGAKSYKEPSSSEDEDDRPLSKRRKTSAVRDESDSDDEPIAAKKPPKISARQIGEDSDSDVPLTKMLANEKKQIEKAAEKTAKSIRAGEEKATKKKKAKKVESSDEDNEPIAKKKVAKNATANGVRKEETIPKNAAAKSEKGKGKAASATPKGKSKSKTGSPDEEEVMEEEEEYRWWEDPSKGDGSIKWTTLEHNGVLFPPPYEPLPKNVRLHYKGQPVTLHPDAEEIAGFYGAMLHSEVNTKNKTFNANFFKDFKSMLDKTGHAKDRGGNKVKITSFDDLNFDAIHQYYMNEREKKKALPAAEKKAIKAQKEEAEAPYQFCKWDGRKQKVGNFRVEPPGLFRGRGEHPKTGHVKQRVQPEQVTINIGKEATVPPAPPGHKWKEVKNDQTGTWLAMWQENINGAYKYVMLAANSDVKGHSDWKKFEKARELKKHIDRIRKDYTQELKSEVMADRQRATAVYLIDRFALRAGNEKGEDEADTVGCCSLKFEHVTLKPPNIVIFDFLGKDSIRFYDEVEVDAQVFKNLKIFKKAPKKDGDEIFDRLTTSALNKHLSTYMQGLTAKVFRTYNASWTMSELLKTMKSTGTIPERVKDYNDANRKVAILCNHKRTVAASHATSIEKMQDKINALRYQQWRCKMMMLDLDPKLKKKRGADFFERDEDLDDEVVQRLQQIEIEEQRTKIRKKLEKEQEKAKEAGEKTLTEKQFEKELKERLEPADDLEKKYKKENKTKKVDAEGKSPSVEKLEANIQKLSQRIETMRIQMQDKDDNKEVALGTSKINYIDPRLTVIFSKKFNVPIEKFFSKTLREKFDWAIKSVDENWEF